MESTFPRPPAPWLRGALEDVGYTVEGIREAVGTVDSPFRGGELLARLRYETQPATPLSLLLRAFLVGDDVDAGEMRAHVPERIVDELVGAGLLAEEAGAFVPTISLRPVEDQLLAYDPRRAFPSPEVVPGPSPSGITLHSATIRRSVGRALDLGTGCGFQALGVAAHSDRVVATDIVPRACELTALNAALNGFDHVETRCGDRFEPVEGERFDLIVANPPFAITPGGGLTFYESGEELDAFCEGLVREAPAHLEVGGVLQMILEWVETEAEEGRDRLARWVEDSGCDTWVVPRYASPAAEYVSTRRQEALLHRGPEEEVLAGHSEWRRRLEDAGVTRIWGGVLTMRRTAGRAGVFSHEGMTTTPGTPWGGTLERSLDAVAYLAAHPDDGEFLDARPSLADGVRIEQRHTRREGTWQPGGMSLSVDAGLPRTVHTETALVTAFSKLDGRTTVREAIEAAAREPGKVAASLQPEFVRILRRLVDRGFLLPPPGRRTSGR